MDKSIAPMVRKIFIAISVVWMAAMGWLQFGNLNENDVLTPHSAAVRERMDTECTGSFGQRYDCKETIVIRTVRHSLVNMVMRLGIVCVVPILLALIFQNLTRPGGRLSSGGYVPKAPPPAKRTFSSRPTSTARTAMPLAEQEPEEDTPPEDDDMSWKKAAQRHVTRGKPAGEE